MSDAKPDARPTQAMQLHSQTTAVGLPQSIYPTSFEAAMKLAEALAGSDLLPPKLRGSPSSVFMTILTGLDLGISPAAALRNIHVVEGKPYLSAQLKVAICVARRDVCKYFRLVESTTERATWETWRVDRPKPEPPFTYTIDDARRQGLLDRGDDPKKNNWNRNPAAMLRARASSILADITYQELIVGVRTTEEAEDEGVIEMREQAPGAFAAVAPPPARVAQAQEPVSPRNVPAASAEEDAQGTAAAPPSAFERFQIQMAEAADLRQLNAIALRVKAAADTRELEEDQAAALRATFTARWQELGRAGAK